MSSELAIRATELGKCYHIYSSPTDRLKQLLWRGREDYFQEFWAVRDVSFEVRRGETVGIIGRNGSGKSTLLQMVCGTLTPTRGSVEVHGRVAAMLELAPDSIRSSPAARTSTSTGRSSDSRGGSSTRASTRSRPSPTSGPFSTSR